MVKLLKLSILIIFFIVLLIFRMNNNEFTDQTTIIEKVDTKNGVFKLIDSKGNAYIGKLHGVNWPKHNAIPPKALTVIANARKNSVVYSLSEDELSIWYQTISGRESLNTQLQKIFIESKGIN